MTPRTTLQLLALLAAATLSAACSRTTLSGPPELRLGRDECGECGMLICEDRCSSAVLIESDGARSHITFDDIGCMLDYERTRIGEFTIIDRFVRDYDSRAWLDAGAARFLLADPDRLQTPMASGYVAFGDDAAAARQHAQYGEGSATIVAYDRLAQVRKERAERRRAQSAPED